MAPKWGPHVPWALITIWLTHVVYLQYSWLTSTTQPLALVFHPHVNPCSFRFQVRVLGVSTSPLNRKSFCLASGIYFTTLTTCFSFSDTTGTLPGLLCLRTFISLKNNRGVMNYSNCWWNESGTGRGRERRERKANKDEEQIEWVTVGLTAASHNGAVENQCIKVQI